MSTDPTPFVVGLTGRAGSGKDSAADVLVRRHDFTAYAFSTPLQDMLLGMDPVVDQRVRLRSVVDDLGWNRAVADPRFGATIRRYMVGLGAAVRAQLGQDVLVGHLHRRLKDDYGADLAGARVVVRDVRMPEEARFVGSLGGKVLNVHSPSTPHVPHDILTELPDDLVHGSVQSEGGPDRLDRQLRILLRLSVPEMRESR